MPEESIEELRNRMRSFLGHLILASRALNKNKEESNESSVSSWIYSPDYLKPRLGLLALTACLSSLRFFPRRICRLDPDEIAALSTF